MKKIDFSDYAKSMKNQGFHMISDYNRGERYQRDSQTNKSKINWQRHGKKTKKRQLAIVQTNTL